MASALAATAIFGGHINMPGLLQNYFETDLEITNRLGLLRHWATLNNIPVGKLQLGDCLSLWLVFFLYFFFFSPSQMATDFSELMCFLVLVRTDILQQLTAKLHLRFSMLEILLVFLFLTKRLCPENRTDSAKSKSAEDISKMQTASHERWNPWRLIVLKLCFSIYIYPGAG